jgi:hypothetical protein
MGSPSKLPLSAALASFAALAAQAAPAAVQAEPAPPIEVRVDPRIELLTVVARLAEFGEFAMPNSHSPYSEAVEAHFGAHRDHAAVVGLKELRRKHSVSYDAIPCLAVHLGDLPELVERIPFDLPPERLDARWGGARARTWLSELRDFAADTGAAEFFAGQAELYRATEARLQERLSQSRAIPWFDAFYGERRGARYSAIPGLLCGGGNFGAGVRFPDGRPEEITPVFGCWTWDERGVPVFDESYLPLFVHELCHTYTNPVVDAAEDQLAAPLARIYATCEAAMKRQAYGNWKIMGYESLVRASVVRCRLATEGREAAEEQARSEVDAGFRWVPELAAELGRYESDRAQYPTFDAFVPRLVAFFEAYAAKLDELAAKAPRVLSTEPADGAQDVDPGAKELVIRFDRPMRDGSWAIVGRPEDQPRFVGKPSYDAERKVLRVAIELEPGRTYRFSLNSASKRAFTSAEGVPLEPHEVAFTTRR